MKITRRTVMSAICEIDTTRAGPAVRAALLRFAAIAPFQLRLVQRRVGTLVDHGRRVAGSELREPARDRHGHVLTVMPKLRALDRGADLLRDDLRRVQLRHRQQQHELLATDAREKILHALVAPEKVRDAAQQAIAGVVAAAIVDAFEQIHVPDRERQRLRVALPPLILFFEPLLVRVPAVHAGQGIEHEPALLVRAKPDELGGPPLQLRDLALEIDRAPFALGEYASLAIAKREKLLRDRVETRLDLDLERRQVARILDLFVQPVHLRRDRVLETDRVGLPTPRLALLPRAPVLEFGQLPRDLLEEL